MPVFKSFAACFLHAMSLIVDKPFIVQCMVKKNNIYRPNLLCGDTKTTIIQLMSSRAAGTGIASLYESTLVADKTVSCTTPLDAC